MKRFFVFALVLVLLVVSSVAVVSASESEAVSGNWQFTGVTPVSAEVVGGNCIIVLQYTQGYVGDLVGTLTGEVRIVHFGACNQPAAEVFHTEATFQGTIAGVSGTFDLQGSGSADALRNVEGQFFFQAGTGDLDDLHGQIDLTGNLDTGGTYSGSIHFD